MAGDSSEPKLQADPPPAEAAAAEPIKPDEPGEPGAPIPPDAIDVELLRLPQPGPTRHPGVALAVLLLGVLLLLRLRSDLSYSLQSDTPQDVGDARAALSSGTLRPGAHVALSGMPDYRNAVGFDSRGARSASSLFRLLGSGSRVLVVAGSGPLGARPPENRFSGRLRRLDELPYADTIRGFYETRAQVLRALDLGELRAAALDRPLALPMTVRDRAGERLRLEPQTELRVQVAFPDDLRVLLSKEKFPAESDAAREVARLGLPLGPGVETKDGFGYVLRLPAGPARHQAIQRVDARGFFYQARVETYRVAASALIPTAEGLRIPGPAALPQPVRYDVPPAGAVERPTRPDEPAPPGVSPPVEGGVKMVARGDESAILSWRDIESALISAPLRPPADAMVLVDGETPASLRLWVLPLALLLLLFMGFNLWYFVAGVRRPTDSPNAP